MRVLRAFDRQRPWLGLADIVELTGLGRSAAQRFVYTLHQLGYLRRDPNTRRYGLASRVLELAKGMLEGNRLLERSQPLLAELARATRLVSASLSDPGDAPLHAVETVQG
jgi:IclR family pca regulon transcriptional regulator